MSKYVIDSQTLTDIADAVREKGETTSPILVSALAQAVRNINTGGGGDVPDNIIFGEFTPQDNLTEITIDYSKDNAPIFVACFLSEIPTSGKNYLHVCSVGINFDETIKSTMVYYSYNGSVGAFATNNVAVSEMTDTQTTFLTRGGNYVMKLGFTYTYFIVF